jgi:putative holliday junction resolvase
MARLGVAVSDPTKLIATPLPTLKAERKSGRTAEKLMAFLKDYADKQKCEFDKIVIGMPFMMSGKKGHLADEVTHFVELLKSITTIPIETWDERLTSVQADRALQESSFTRKRRAQEVDSVAALILLQNYLDAARIRLEQ